MRRALPSELIDLSIKSSYLWEHFRRFTLTENMRAQEDPAYATFLRLVGDGVTLDGDYGQVRLPKQILSQGDLVDEVYGELFRAVMSEEHRMDYLNGRAILTPLNVDCDAYNSRIVDALPGSAFIYRSADEIIPSSVKDGVNYPPEFLNTLSPGDVPPHELILKPGAMVILIRNANVRKGLCNGTRLLVVECGEHLLKCRILGGDRRGDYVLLHRFSLTSEADGIPFKFMRRQFPVKLAFCLTVNKSQGRLRRAETVLKWKFAGQTLRFAGVDFQNEVFSHGQGKLSTLSDPRAFSYTVPQCFSLAYVALSRVGSSRAIKVLTKNQSEFIDNIVHREILD